MQIKVLKVGSVQICSSSFLLHALIDKTKAQKKEEKDKAAKADDPRAGADIGKIVNLIAGDSNRVRNIVFLGHFSSNFKFY